MTANPDPAGAPGSGEVPEDVRRLLLRVVKNSDARLEDEVRAWAEEVGPEQAADRLAAFVELADLSPIRQLAFQALTFVGEPGGAAVQRLREHPFTGPFATAWLIQHGHLPDDALGPSDELLAIAESLAAMAAIDAANVVAGLRTTGDGGRQHEVVAQLWRVPHPGVADVLDAVSRAHPDKGLAKEARRSLHKLRSSRG
ncbi:hypothetical protein [Allonocardiopsis opalescens]|nr:hypothetical protein [Allonocardiopsis opalescens]